MNIAVISLFLVALACASPVEEPASEERSPRQLYPQHYGQQYFYPRGPYRYPYYFFQPSAFYVQPTPTVDDPSDVTLRAGESIESRQIISNLFCSATSPLATTFICTSALPFAAGFIPASPFQMCKSTNNAGKAAGTVQLLPGLGPRICSFFITLPDNTKKVSVTCSTLNLPDGTAVLNEITASAATLIDSLSKTTAVETTGNKARIDFGSTTGSDNFRCSWTSV